MKTCNEAVKSNGTGTKGLNKIYTTIVIEHKPGSKTQKEFLKAFSQADARFGDAKITALSLEDEISKVEKLENAE